MRKSYVLNKLTRRHVEVHQVRGHVPEVETDESREGQGDVGEGHGGSGEVAQQSSFISVVSDAHLHLTRSVPFRCQKIAKKLTFFFQKNCQQLAFFSTKIAIDNFLEKRQYFAIKKVKFLAFFLYSNANFSEGQSCVLARRRGYRQRDA